MRKSPSMNSICKSKIKGLGSLLVMLIGRWRRLLRRLRACIRACSLRLRNNKIWCRRLWNPLLVSWILRSRGRSLISKSRRLSMKLMVISMTTRKYLIPKVIPSEVPAKMLKSISIHARKNLNLLLTMNINSRNKKISYLCKTYQ